MSFWKDPTILFGIMIVANFLASVFVLKAKRNWKWSEPVKGWEWLTFMAALLGGWPAARLTAKWKQYKYRRCAPIRPIRRSRFYRKLSIALISSILILAWAGYCWYEQLPKTMVATGTAPLSSIVEGGSFYLKKFDTMIGV